MSTSTIPRRNPKKVKYQLDAFLHQYSFIFFILFFALAIWAFWTSYYGISSSGMAGAIRFHGITMTTWCVLLIVQPFLIRLKKKRIHKWIGKFSYLLVPFILFSGAHLAHLTIMQQPAGSTSYYFSIALMYNSLIAFAIIYGFAVYFRKNAALHSRFMVCTVFPLITPVTDRLIYKYFPSLIEYAPAMADGSPMVPALGFAVADIIIVTLLIWDWIKHKRPDVFLFVLGILLLYHASVIVFYDAPFWHKIADVMMKVPLS